MMNLFEKNLSSFYYRSGTNSSKCNLIRGEGVRLSTPLTQFVVHSQSAFLGSDDHIHMESSTRVIGMSQS